VMLIVLAVLLPIIEINQLARWPPGAAPQGAGPPRGRPV